MSENFVTMPRQVILEPKMLISKNIALFALGDVVRHKIHGYRGLIFDVDAVFFQTDEWYAMMASSNPPKDAPWYHVLVDGKDHTTYVPQNSLLLHEGTNVEIDHPLVKHFFQETAEGIFHTKTPLN